MPGYKVLSLERWKDCAGADVLTNTNDCCTALRACGQTRFCSKQACRGVSGIRYYWMPSYSSHTIPITCAAAFLFLLIAMCDVILIVFFSALV